MSFNITHYTHKRMRGIVVLNRRRLVFCGEACQVKSHIANPFTPVAADFFTHVFR